MTETEKLQEQVNELQKIVEDLKGSSIRIETNNAKLSRLKNEILAEVFDNKYDAFMIGSVKKQ